MPVPMEVHVIPVQGAKRLALIYVEDRRADIVDGWNPADVNKAVQNVINFCFRKGFPTKGATPGRVQASQVTLKFFNHGGGVCGEVRTFGRKDGQSREITSQCPAGWGKVAVAAAPRATAAAARPATAAAPAKPAAAPAAAPAPATGLQYDRGALFGGKAATKAQLLKELRAGGIKIVKSSVQGKDVFVMVAAASWTKLKSLRSDFDVADSDEMSGHGGGGKGFTAESRAKAAATRKKNAKAKAVAAALKSPEMVAARQRGRDKAKATKAKAEEAARLNRAAAFADLASVPEKKSGSRKGGRRPTVAAASAGSISPVDFLTGLLPAAKSAAKSAATAAKSAVKSAAKAASGGRAPNAWNAFSSQYRAAHPGAKMPAIRKAYAAATSK